MLKKRHVAGGAEISRRLSLMMRVLLRHETLARMATGALAVVELSGQRISEHITIFLRVRVVAIHAGHRSIPEAIAVKVVALVSKRTHPPVGRIGSLELRHLD